MSEQRNKGKVRADPRQKRSEERTSTYLCDISTYDMLCSSGYASLAKNPEIISAVNKIANLIGSMSIHLMQIYGSGTDYRARSTSNRIAT